MLGRDLLHLIQDGVVQVAIHDTDLLGVSDDVLRNIPLEHWEDDLSAD